jgi:hypothetical protein
LEQAEEYFKAASQGGVLRVKPVLLYYSLLNLAKCVILVRNPTLDMARIACRICGAFQRLCTSGAPKNTGKLERLEKITQGLAETQDRISGSGTVRDRQAGKFSASRARKSVTRRADRILSNFEAAFTRF